MLVMGIIAGFRMVIHDMMKIQRANENTDRYGSGAHSDDNGKDDSASDDAED